MTDSEIKELEEKARALSDDGNNDMALDEFQPLANPTAILSLIERLRECEEALEKEVPHWYDEESKGITYEGEYFDKWRRE